MLFIVHCAYLCFSFLIHVRLCLADHADAMTEKDNHQTAELQAKEAIITELRAKEASLSAEVTQLQESLKETETRLKGQSHELDEQSEVIEGLEEEIRTLQGQITKDNDSDKNLTLVNPSHGNSVAASASTTADLLDMEEFAAPAAPSLTPISTTDSADLISKQQEIDALRAELIKANQLVNDKDGQIQSLEQASLQQSQSVAADINSKQQELLALQEQLSKISHDLKDRDRQIESMRSEEQKHQQLVAHTDIDSKHVEALKSELNEKNDTIQALKAESSDLSVKLKLSETQRTTAETQRADLIKEKENNSKVLSERESLFSKAQQEWETKENDLRLQLDAANKSVRDKSSENNQEIESMQTSLAKKSAEYDMVYAELMKLRSLSSEQQSLNADNVNQIEKLNASLQAEINKNQEAKKKVRAFVDNLTAEKTAAEDHVRVLETKIIEANDKINVMEQQNKIMEMKLTTSKEQSILEQEKMVKERQNFESSLSLQLQDKDAEINKLKDLLENSNKNTQAEMQEALRQVNTASKEAEQHKTKRLEARNETIHLVQALEKAQGEADQVQAFLQKDLVPMAYEQVSGIENALMSLETAVGLLSSKKMVKFHSKAHDFIERRLKTGRKKRGDRATLLPNGSTRSDGGSGSANNGCLDNDSIAIGQRVPRNSTAALDSPVEGIDTTSLTPLSQMVSARTGGASSTLSKAEKRHISGLGDAMELAQNLYNEMDRMRAGILLLTQSLERLHETVRLDTKCCGGVYELIVASMQQSNNIQRGYAMTADREEDDDVLMTTPTTIRSSNIHSVGGRPAARIDSNDSDESKGEFL